MTDLNNSVRDLKLDRFDGYDFSGVLDYAAFSFFEEQIYSVFNKDESGDMDTFDLSVLFKMYETQRVFKITYADDIVLDVFEIHVSSVLDLNYKMMIDFICQQANCKDSIEVVNAQTQKYEDAFRHDDRIRDKYDELDITDKERLDTHDAIITTSKLREKDFEDKLSSIESRIAELKELYF